MPHKEKTRYPRALALKVAAELQPAIKPTLERGKIGGSVRRGLKEVGDLELVVIPKFVATTADLFDGDIQKSTLHQRIEELLGAGVLQHRGAFGQANMYLRHTETGLPIDIFVASEINWGMFYFVRTGPADYIKRAMQRFLQLRKKGHAYGGVTLANGTKVTCPTEEVVFDQLEWPYAQPEDRR